VVGPGWAELAAAVGSSSVVVGLVPGKDAAQVAFAEDEHPIGDLSPGGEHEPCGTSFVCAAAAEIAESDG
jgi:hypothetical protein